MCSVAYSPCEVLHINDVQHGPAWQRDGTRVCHLNEAQSAYHDARQ